MFIIIGYLSVYYRLSFENLKIVVKCTELSGIGELCLYLIFSVQCQLAYRQC